MRYDEKEEDRIFLIRHRLKVKLVRERGTRCQLCERYATDMHEVFITRADYGRKEGQERIFQPWNCVLVCRQCHMIMGSVLQVRLGSLLVEVYGAEYIEAKVAELRPKTWKGLEAWFAQHKSPKPDINHSVMTKSQLAHFKSLLRKEGKL